MQILQRNLDDDQRKIAESVNENLLVLAGPGSGKTRLLTNLAGYLLRQSPNQAWRVCCLTFTVEAAKQLRTRLGSRDLGNIPGHRVWAGNFHQLAQLLLRSYGHLLGWPRTAGIIPPPDVEALVEDIVEELSIGKIDVRSIITAISARKGRRPLPYDLEQRSELFAHIFDTYQERLRQANLRDFDDLILDALRLLREHPSVQRIVHDTYRYILVDELQDTNQLQLDFIAAITHDDTGHIIGVADADQMIYAWRDARPENLREFEERFKARIVSLGGNYRCPPRIVEAAVGLINNNPNRERSAQDLRSLVSDHDGELWEAVAPDEGEEYELIADIVERTLREGGRPEEIVILAPHRFKFADLRTTLDIREIPHVYIGSDELQRCPIVRVIRACLMGLANPERPAKQRKVVDKANEYIGYQWLDNTVIPLAIFASVNVSPHRLYAEFMASLGLSPALIGSDVVVQARLKRLSKMFTYAASSENPQTSAELAALVLFDWERLEAQVLKSEQAVKLMTTYGAKGLEFATVILPFCTKNLVPYIPARERRNPEAWYEARRNFYVALTRSTRRVIFTRSAGPRSIFLDEIPEHLITPWVE